MSFVQVDRRCLSCVRAGDSSHCARYILPVGVVSNACHITTYDANAASLSDLFFCVALEEALVNRSSILQSLCQANHAGGPQELPAAVCKEDFNMWAVTDPRSLRATRLSWMGVARIIRVSVLLLHRCI